MSARPVGDPPSCRAAAGGTGPLLRPALPLPTIPPPADSLEAVIALVFARAAPGRPDLRSAVEQRLHLLPAPPGAGPPSPLGDGLYRSIRARAGRVGCSAGAPAVLLAAACLEPELTALTDQGSARLLALAHLADGRATAATVRTLMRVFGLEPATYRSLPAADRGGGSVDWDEVLPLLRRRGVMGLTAEPSRADGRWLGRRHVAVIDQTLVQGRDRTSRLRYPVRSQLAACGALAVPEVLIGLRRTGPALGHVTERDLALWVACQGDLQLHGHEVQLAQRWALLGSDQTVRNCFATPGSVVSRHELLLRLQEAGLTKGTARHEIVVSPFLRSAGRGLYRLAGQELIC